MRKLSAEIGYSPAAIYPYFASKEELLRSMLAACLGGGSGRSARGELGSRALWSAVHGVTSLLIQRPGFPWLSQEAVVRQVIDSAVAGALAAKLPTRTHGGRDV